MIALYYLIISTLYLLSINDLYYLMRAIVYAQPFIWLYFLDKDIDIKGRYIKLLYPVALSSLYLILGITGFGFSQYNNELLMFYILLMLYSYYVLKHNYNFKDTVCLSFLLVFINSYYWEFMLHLNAIMFYGLSFNQLIQGFHLIPVYFLYRKIEIKDTRRVKKLILYGLIISTLNILALNLFPFTFNGIVFYPDRNLINDITRISCLTILLIIFITKIEIKKKGVI